MNIYLGQVTIPPDWTGDQALAVVEFLDDISNAIWKIHEQKILDFMNKREREESGTDEKDGRPLRPEDDLYYLPLANNPADDDYPF